MNLLNIDYRTLWTPIPSCSVFTISYSLGTFVGPIVAGALFQRVGFLWTMVAFCAIVLSALPVLMCADLAYADTVVDGNDKVHSRENAHLSGQSGAGDSRSAATVTTPLNSAPRSSVDRAAAAESASLRIDAVTAALQDAADMNADEDADDGGGEAGGGASSYRSRPLSRSGRMSP